MNYQRLYVNIITNRQHTPLSKDKYTETHHIIPKSLNGSNAKTDLVRLSAREHFICHLLLCKMYPRYSTSWIKMMKAFNKMTQITNTQTRYINSYIYTKLKKDFSIAQSLSQSGAGNSQFGKKWYYNPITKQAKSLYKHDWERYELDGWTHGRVAKNKPKERKPKERKPKEHRTLVTNINTGVKKLIKVKDVSTMAPEWTSLRSKLNEEHIINQPIKGNTLKQIAAEYGLSYHNFYSWYTQRKDNIQSRLPKRCKVCPVCGKQVRKDHKYCSADCLQISNKSRVWVRCHNELKHITKSELLNYVKQGWIEVLPVRGKTFDKWKPVENS